MQHSSVFLILLMSRFRGCISFVKPNWFTIFRFAAFLLQNLNQFGLNLANQFGEGLMRETKREKSHHEYKEFYLHVLKRVFTDTYSSSENVVTLVVKTTASKPNLSQHLYMQTETGFGIDT